MRIHKKQEDTLFYRLGKNQRAPKMAPLVKFGEMDRQKTTETNKRKGKIFKFIKNLRDMPMIKIAYPAILSTARAEKYDQKIR